MLKLKIEPSQINIGETPENLFLQYQEKFSIEFLQKLYNLGIYLHVIKGNKWERLADYKINLENHKIVMLYDKIGETLKFTKIGVYNKK